MLRKLTIVVALSALVLGATPASGKPGAALLQTGESEEPPTAAVQLAPGDIFAGTGYELGLGGAVIEPSATTTGVTEIRVAVAFRNTSGFVLPAWTPGFDDLGFPLLLVRDALGQLHDVDRLHPASAALPGHDLVEIPSETSSRWTLGYQVPTAATAELELVVVDTGFEVASWRIAEEAPGVTLPSPQLDAVSLGEQVEWLPGLLVTPRATGSLVCGDPDIESVAHIFAVSFDVANATTSDVRWPGFIHRSPAAVAQWSDGSAAAMSIETFFGSDETLPRVSAHAVLFPPLTSSTRALVFAAPRDGRLTDVSSLPAGVRLPTSSGDLWLDLDGVNPSFGIDPAMCDLGGNGAPVPYAFSPGPKFDIRGEGPFIERTEADAAALHLLTSARAGATRLWDANQSIARLGEDDFDEAVPNIGIVEITAGKDNPTGTLGTVYYDVDLSRSRFLFLATRSQSGTWFCMAGDLFTTPVGGSGPRLQDAGNECYTESFSPDPGG